MKLIFLAALCCAPVAACAGQSTTVASVEQGYPNGALAVAAIAREDWKTAETLLTSDTSAAAGDPARLINLGKVYMETGRAELALATWERAAASKRHHVVETAEGRFASTEDLVREALAHYSPAVRQAARPLSTDLAANAAR